MDISTKTVEKIAKLGRIRLEEQEIHRMKEDLGQILEWMDKLQELSTDDVEPLVSPSQETNVYREDNARNMFKGTEPFENAPDKVEAYFKVPKVKD